MTQAEPGFSKSLLKEALFQCDSSKFLVGISSELNRTLHSGKHLFETLLHLVIHIRTVVGHSLVSLILIVQCTPAR